MPDLSYPLAFDCSHCEHRIIVTRDTVRGVFQPSEPDFNSLDTINTVLRQRGWLRDEIEHRVFCPDCADPEWVD